MGVLRSGKLRVLVVTCVVFLLLGVEGASPGAALAQGAEPNQPFMCWVSGPLDGDDGSLESWTVDTDQEFVVDLVGDVENRLPEQSAFEPRALIDEWRNTEDPPLAGYPPPNLIPFRTLREAVDYTFATNPMAADVVSGEANDGTVKDLRLELLRGVLGGTDITDDAWKLERGLPWLTSDQYFKRRRVATPSEDRIRVYRAQWLDREPVDVDLGEMRQSSLPDQSGTSGAYGQRSQGDGGSDQFSVILELDPFQREDFRWDGGDLGQDLIMRRFGPPRFRTVYKGYGENRTRLESYNERDGEERENPLLLVDHTGYRQPSLSRAFNVANPPLSSAGVSHIRWPVDLQDLNWYLYQLPGEYQRGDMHWMLWLDGDAVRKLVNGGYGLSALPLIQNPLIPDPPIVPPVCDLKGQVVLPKNINCVVDGADDLDKLRKGEVPGVYFPFDTDDGSEGLNRDMLVLQGVERPKEDEGQDVRSLSVFQFDVKEQEPMGRVTESGGQAEARYGIPTERDARDTYIEGWPRRAINPNRSYLMVITYYESYYHYYDLESRVTFENYLDGSRVRLPKRYVRRVVCRLMVSPSGLTPSGEEGGGGIGWLNSAAEKVFQAVGKGLEVLSGWLSSVLRAVISFPGWGVKQGGALACGGLSKVDELTARAAGADAGTRVSESGDVLVVNAAVSSRKEGFDDCERVSAPVVPTCETSTDVIFQGRCVQLPRVELRVKDAEFIDLDSDQPYIHWYPAWSRPPVGSGASLLTKRREQRLFFDSEGTDPSSWHPRNVGLTRVGLYWDFLGGTGSPALEEQVRGYVAYVWPDPKSTRLEEGKGLRFVLPSMIEEKGKAPILGGDDDDYYLFHDVDEFSVGGVDRPTPGRRKCSNSLVSVGLDHPGECDGLTAIGSQYVKEDYLGFVGTVGNLPLAPGFSHRFAVAAYVGEPGYSTFREGPMSEPLVINGDEAACLTGLRGDITPRVEELYGCGGAGYDTGYVDEPFRVGLLGLTGTNLCYDIFSSTPPEFTWDNPIVRQVWALAWIIAGGIFFSLLVWQGVKMTYDIWIEPQPAVGFRQLVPRFLLAIALAAGSLYISQLVLILASDVTCFVAQVTGMTMWGMIGSTFGALLDGFLAWHGGFLEEVGGMHLTELLKGVFFALALTIVLAIFMVGLLFLFIKVALAMLMRIALLAVLIAVSPLAFAFFASDATSHWTKKWVSMFLGSTFQQVFVLVVVYIGGHLAGHYMSVGQDTGMGEMVIGLLLAFLTLALADKVPSIVNPQGQGLFQSFSQLGQLAMAGTFMAASVGIGAVAAPIGQAFPMAGQGLRSVAGGVRGLGGSGGGEGGGGGGDSGGSGVDMGLGGPGGGGPGGGGPGGGPGRGLGGGGSQAVSSLRGASFSGPGSGPSGGAAALGGGGGGAAAGGAAPGGGGGGGAAALGGGGGGAAAGGAAAGGAAAAAGAGAGALGQAGRAAMWLPRQMLSGARSGYRTGARTNVRMSDMMSGNFLYKASSRGDDAAMELERQGHDTRQSYDRMAQVMERLNQNLGEGGPG